MPGGDGTGPMGMGSMTGRGMGYCAGYSVPGSANYGFGRGMGCGRGFRRMFNRTGMMGWARYGAYPYGFQPNSSQAAAVDDREVLQNQAAFLEKQLNQVRDQLSKLKETE